LLFFYGERIWIGKIDRRSVLDNRRMGLLGEGQKACVTWEWHGELAERRKMNVMIDILIFLK
jgi:hypothetical protein